MKKFIILLMIIPVWSFAQKEMKVVRDSLPASVNIMLNKKYKKYKVDDIVKITDKKGNISFSLSIAKNSKIIDFLYDKNGLLISKNKYKLYIVNENNNIVQRPSGGVEHNHQQSFSSGGGHQH